MGRGRCQIVRPQHLLGQSRRRPDGRAGGQAGCHWHDTHRTRKVCRCIGLLRRRSEFDPRGRRVEAAEKQHHAWYCKSPAVAALKQKAAGEVISNRLMTTERYVSTGWIWTPGPQVRSQVLYPTELR